MLFRPAPSNPERAFCYRGRDGRLLQTVVAMGTPPDEIGPGVARWRFVLEHQAPQRVEWEIARDDEVVVAAVVRIRGLVEGSWIEQLLVHGDHPARCLPPALVVEVDTEGGQEVRGGLLGRRHDMEMAVVSDCG